MSTTEIVQHGGQLDRHAGFNGDQLDLLKRTIAAGTNDDEFQLFVAVATRAGLDPFARQIYAVMRWDSRAKREVMTIQTGIDGYRLIASRTGRHAGTDGPFWRSKDTEWSDVWLEDSPPAAAKVIVHARDRGTYTGVATYAGYAQLKDGKPLNLWASMPDVMLGKCAEAQALRRAFPAELSGVYTDDEMGQADNRSTPKPAAAPRAPHHEDDTPQLVAVLDSSDPWSGWNGDQWATWGRNNGVTSEQAKAATRIPTWADVARAPHHKQAAVYALGGDIPDGEPFE